MTNARNGLDPLLAILICIAAGLGAFVVWDAAFPSAILKGSGAIPSDFIKHVLGLCLAAAAFFIVGNFRHKMLRVFGAWFFWIALFLCALLFIPGFGKDLGTNAKRWLGPGPFNFQPAELLKPATILFLAVWGCKRLPAFGNRRRDWVEKLDNRVLPLMARLFPLVAVAAAFIIVEQEPDLGTAVVILSIAFGMLIFGVGKSLFGKHSVAVMIALIVVSSLGLAYFAKTKLYRADRIGAHFSRWDPAYVDGAGYQTGQAELAQAYAGPWGVGVGQGRAKHVLPAATTDFAPVTPFEEFGVIGSLLVVGLLAGISFRLLYLAKGVEEPFHKFIVQGTGWWIGTQSVFNLLMSGGAIPAVGIPLPFFSYGNSSLLALGIALGATRAALANRRPAEAKYAHGRNRGRNRRPRLSRA